MSDEQPIQFKRNAKKPKLENEAYNLGYSIVLFTTYDEMKSLR